MWTVLLNSLSEKAEDSNSVLVSSRKDRIVGALPMFQIELFACAIFLLLYLERAITAVASAILALETARKFLVTQHDVRLKDLSCEFAERNRQDCTRNSCPPCHEQPASRVSPRLICRIVRRLSSDARMNEAERGDSASQT